MIKFYTEKDVKKLVLRLKEEYDGALKRSREAVERLKGENRSLKARLLELEAERGQVSSAMLHAVSEGEKIRRDGEMEIEQRRKELKLLAEKCRLLNERVSRYLPEGEERELSAFQTELSRALSLEEEESGLDMDEVLSPQYPLDLEKLCKELGVMEEES